MEQHPIPQQISSYEFRLVGDMTLKQFFQLAGGCVMALIVYASGLPGYFKWPLIVFFGLLGIAMAFIPFEERPLHVWIISFLKAVYSPTQYFWQKKPKIPEFLEKKQISFSPKPIPTQILPNQEKLKDYLKTLPEKGLETEVEKKEENQLKQIFHLFDSVSLPLMAKIEPTPLENINQPAGIKFRQFGPPFIPEEKTSSLPSFDIEKPLKPLGFYSPRRPGRPPKKKIEFPATQAESAPKILFPSIPSIPNIIVGVVRDPEGKLVEEAIMEIRDEQGNPVRALKTNKIGQFRIAAPLPSGTYEIETEKEGLVFDIVKITLKGEIVQPIEIRARAKKSNQEEILNITGGNQEYGRSA